MLAECARRGSAPALLTPRTGGTAGGWRTKGQMRLDTSALAPAARIWPPQAAHTQSQKSAPQALIPMHRWKSWWLGNKAQRRLDISALAPRSTYMAAPSCIHPSTHEKVVTEQKPSLSYLLAARSEIELCGPPHLWRLARRWLDMPKRFDGRPA